MLDRRLEDDEFVAAEARHHVGVADDLAQPVGHRAQQLVAAGMAERVVDLLELIEIDEQHGAGLARMPRGSQRLVDLVAKVSPVRQAGERVVARHVADLGLGVLALGDVLDQHDRAAVFHRLEGEREIASVQRVDDDVARLAVALMRLVLRLTSGW